MTKNKLSKELQEVSDNHISSVDKLYRMHAGLSSELISFDGNILELVIRHSDRWPKPPNKTADQLAKSWRQNKALSKATRYRVHLYKREVATGALAPLPKKIKPGKELDAFITFFISGLKAASDSSKDRFIETIEGPFEN